MGLILIVLVELVVVLLSILYCVIWVSNKFKQIIESLNKIEDHIKNEQSVQWQQPELFSNYGTTSSMVKRLDKEAKKLERRKRNDM